MKIGCVNLIKQIDIEKREKGFSMYVNGANSPRRYGLICHYSFDKNRSRTAAKRFVPNDRVVFRFLPSVGEHRRPKRASSRSSIANVHSCANYLSRACDGGDAAAEVRLLSCF
jgi:hypothetical protein